ncbi:MULTISPECIES: DEAD/DEAH box helicase [unclassified Bacteroides]|uniref:DEAD/DEAH box helicase n=1 Tax=unclassified Bacteroides TaxID=2646097 RepID=UPI0004E21277|nr:MULTISPECIES: DEAD/DEAH box helicase [unclassified Bacteroides]
MKKFEHLFSQDPIGAFEKIEEDYTRYFEVSYKISNTEINKERMDVLRADNNLSKEPYLEVLPEYSPAEGLRNMDDLVSRFSGHFGGETFAREYFEEFIAKGLMQGLMDKYIPYGHQIGMLEKAFAGIDENGNPLKYKNTVITSGTGSGKTESFMLPLLADIYKEYISSSWAPAISHAKWFEGRIEGRSKKRQYIPNQRLNDPRPAAIRALVLYPMNALVEDQMARLREALDSNDVRAFMHNKMQGNRIYFGSYNGSTIAPKSYDLLNNPDHKTAFTKKKQEVAEQLNKIHEHFEFVNRYVAANPDKKDALYIEPRLGGDLTTSEMITRWDMQYWAPDIMITNTSMLSIMLMRKAESKMFDDTRRWLAAEDLPEAEREEAKKNRVFHIIVDELHLYRGTAGSEVACLLRMLYNAIGLEPVVDDDRGNKVPNPQIKILASSASLGDETETQKFMEEFFGIYSTIEGENVFNVQVGSNYIGKNKDVIIDYTSFSEFNHENFVAIELDPENAGKVEDVRKGKVLNFLKEKFDCDTIEKFCKRYEEQMFKDFYDCLPSNTDNSKRPISQSQLIESLFAGNKEAYRGFLIFRGYIDTIYKNHKLPRFRFHKFFKYVEGLWGELNPSLSDDVPAVKNLSYNSKEVGARKVLELLRCENCGQLFIGGNRKRETNDGSVSLTLNFPNLEQIPNFNPTPMVQNKTYQDYAIFWPKDLNTKIELERKGTPEAGANDRVVEILTGKHGTDLGKADWVPGYLDSLTGKFTPKDQSLAPNTGSLMDSIKTNGIQGFLYRVVNNNNGAEIDDIKASKIYAAPCTCPHCLQDYTLRKYTNSPIRSFRTGIDRSNQILSKELLYQLDDNSAKLIGFSDSREDAAKQALGIEKEQYRDMVRMLFVDSVNEVGINDIVDFIKQQLSIGTKKKEIREAVKSKWLRPDISDVTNAIFDAIDDDDFSGLSQYSQNNIPLSNFIGNGFDGTLVRKLLERGINPAGEAHKFQWYEKDNAEGLFHWSTAYDFSKFALVQYPHFKKEEYKSQIRKQLENAIFANSFGKYMGVSVLDAGIGYISSPQSDAVEASNEYQTLRRLLPTDVSVYEFVDAFIRVMGDNYLYPSVEEGNAYVDYEHLKGSVKRPIKVFCERRGGDENSLGDALVRYLKKYCTDINVLSLELEKLSFTKMTNEKYMKCPKCGRVHPNKGFGFCTNTSCMEKLDPSVTVDTDSLHDHYISFDILKEKRAPRRLHTEELSGQTDDIQARLREFKDLILIDDNDPTKLGKEMTMPIDMVCVTTTMEVGVDIGSLQAIFQGNMPPTRYNYQQRVGRGGRRGQAYSTAFTFCRGRSHDVYYYEKATDEMVGGIPATPTLSLAPYKDTNGEVRMKQAIMKRVIVKEVLHQAFLSLPYQYDLQDTAGEFGRIADWGVNQKELKNWLASNEDAVNGIVHRYFDQFNTNNQIQKDIKEIIEWILTKMVGQIDFAVKKTSNKDKGLAEYLSEAGFLPMYGMPSDSRNFYHGFDSVFKRVKSVDRSSEIAISEFAPGSEKTKDKGKYRVEGLTIPMIDEANDRGQISFFNPNGDALSDRYILTYIKNIGEDDNNIKEIIEAPVGVPSHQIKLTDKQRLIVIPQAYRSLQIKGNTGTPVENNDKGSSFTQSQIFARDNSSSSAPSNKKTVGNVDISVYEMGLNEDPTVWHVNSNNNRFYTGAYSANGLEMPYGKMANFMFFDKYNTNGRTETSRKDQDPQNTLDIALGSKKITEMIKLELKTYPSVLNLSLETGNRSAIRAAFYSAAFLLQRALADKLDVQPDEIEICEKIDDKFEYPSLYLSDALPNGAGIVSYLYQDGKLEELIRSIINFDSFDSDKTSKDKSFMQSLISEKHMRNCLTACQKCLLTYSNRGFHHVLDWRLGVGLLRLMLDETYDFGFDASTRGRYEEMSDWNYIIHECAQKYNFAPESNEQYYWFKDGACTVFYHPLWNRKKLLENITEQYDGLHMFNTFKILRSDMTEDKDDSIVAHTCSGVKRLNRIKASKLNSSRTIAPQQIKTEDDNDVEL